MSQRLVCEHCQISNDYEDHLAGRPARCPTCGSPVAVPLLVPGPADDTGDPVREVPGRTIRVLGGFVFPMLFGKTTLQIRDDTLYEWTTLFIHRRDGEALLSEITSVEIVVQCHPLLFWLGALTLWPHGLGVIFLLLSCLIDHRYLLVRCKGGRPIAVTLQGDEAPYRSFKATLLAAARRAKQMTPAIAETLGHVTRSET